MWQLQRTGQGCTWPCLLSGCSKSGCLAGAEGLAASTGVKVTCPTEVHTSEFTGLRPVHAEREKHLATFLISAVCPLQELQNSLPGLCEVLGEAA